jgi:hypothetical protein
MTYHAQNMFRKWLFYRMCLESAPRPDQWQPAPRPPARRPGGRTQSQLYQLKRKLLRIALEETAGEARLFKQICGAANQAADLAWTESCPLLIFPCLFEELVQVAREQNQQAEAR